MKWKCAVLVLCLVTASMACSGLGEGYIDPTRNPDAPEYDSTRPDTLLQSQIAASSFLLMDLDTMEVLMEHDPRAQNDPSLAAALIVGLIAAEAGSPDDLLIADEGIESMADELSVLPLTVGEAMTLSDLLHAVLMQHACDAVHVIANHYAENEAAFVAQMNAKAAEIGCEDTAFTNMLGYGTPNQHTTAYDTALILARALDNALLRDILSKAEYTLAETNLNPARTITTSNGLLYNPLDSHSLYPSCIGGKAAFSSRSGYGFASAATREGRTLIVSFYGSGKYSRWVDAVRLFDYGFASMPE